MTDPFCIDKKLIGTERHLLVSNGFAWVNSVPTGAWHLTGELKESGRCLDTLFRLNAVDIDINPPQRYYQAMQTLMSGSVSWPPPWRDVMPKATHRSFVEALVQTVAVTLDTTPKEYYDRIWVPGNTVFGSLERATVKRTRLAAFLESGEGNISALKSFIPDQSGLANQVRYDRFGTRTGRPTIQSGPSILTLKREHRKLLGSRWGEQGKVLMLDFSALEVRVILYEAGKSCDNPDLYAEVNQEVFNSKLPRNIVKGAVISDLYGMSKWAIGEQLGIKGKHLDMFINRLRSHFKTGELLKHVKQQFIELGYITNHYGRRVKIEEPLDHILINSYAQSTGADVVTLGFKEIIAQISGLQAIPIFLLSDAILVDCHVDAVEHIKKIKNVSVEGYDQRWPLKVEEI